MIRVTISGDILGTMFIKGSQLDKSECVDGIPSTAELVDVTLKYDANLDPIVEFIYDIHDGIIQIHDKAITWQQKP